MVVAATLCGMDPFEGNPGTARRIVLNILSDDTAP